MEIPDKEDDPYNYAEMKLNKIRKSKFISKQNKELLNQFGSYVFCVGREIDNCYIQDLHKYILDSFDLMCDLITYSERDSKTSLIHQFNACCENILQNIENIQVVLEAMGEGNKILEVRVLSESINKTMKIQTR